MRHQITEANGKALLFAVIEMVLIAEKDHLVLQQRLVDGADRGIREIAGQADIPDFGAKAPGEPDDVEIGNGRINECRLGHIGLQFGLGDGFNR